MKQNKILYTIGITLISCSFIAGVLFYWITSSGKEPKIFINEVCTKNVYCKI